MSRLGETANRPQADVFQGQLDASRADHEVLRGLDGKQACPFCGSVSEKSASPCARCGMDNTPEARKATKARIGPWYVLQARNPAAPGMRFETLLSFVRKGRVRARSVVRGPTTHQLWRFAAHVKGLSREFGMCFSCGSAIEATANICPQCNRLQEPPLNPDILLEDGSDADAPRPVYRELPNPAEASAPLPDAQPPAPEPPPEDVDIVIPAFGAFEHLDVDPKTPEIPPTAPAPSAAPAARPTSPFASGPARPSAPAPASSPRPAFNENPFAIAPARKKGNGDSTFLSAKDLAAAFKLSFDPSADMETVDVPDQMPASAMPEGMRPTALTPRPPMQQMQMSLAGPAFEPAPKQRGAFKKLVIFLLIVAVTGFVVMLWVDPAFRQRAFEKTKATYTKLSRYANGTDVPPERTPTDREPAPDKLEAIPPAEDLSETPDPASLSPENPGAVPDEETSVDVEEETPGAKDPPTPAKADPLTAPSPANVKTTAPPVAPSAELPGEKVTAENLMQIYGRGVKAQGAGDYAAAIRDFEAIKKLPPPWPGDLLGRLARAKKDRDAAKAKPAGK